MDRAESFSNVCPSGEGGGDQTRRGSKKRQVDHLYKALPWTHQNPYHIRADYRGSPILVGSTDSWEPKWASFVPPSGQQIYVDAKKGINPEAFYEVVALLEEEDIEVPGDENAVLKTIDGANWGVSKADDAISRIAGFERDLELAPTVIEDMASNEKPARGAEAAKQVMLANCQRAASTGPTHSMRSRFAQAVGAFLAEDLADLIETRWLEDVLVEQTDAVPAPPAPGYHDSRAFPEMNQQRIPEDAHMASAEQMDQAPHLEGRGRSEQDTEERELPEGRAREQASLRLPAPDGGDDEVGERELTEGRAREQASPRLPAPDGGVDEVGERELPEGNAGERASLPLPAQEGGDDKNRDGQTEDEDMSDTEDKTAKTRRRARRRNRRTPSMTKRRLTRRNRRTPPKSTLTWVARWPGTRSSSVGLPT